MIGATSGASEVAALDSPLTHRDGVRACALPATLLKNLDGPCLPNPPYPKIQPKKNKKNKAAPGSTVLSL